MKFRTLLLTHFANTQEFARAMDVTWPTGRKYERYPLTMSSQHIEKLSKLMNIDTC